MKPLRKKLQKCRDPDRVDLVALQRARREQAMTKAPALPVAKQDNDVFGGETRDIKRRKVGGQDDVFGPPL